MFPTKNYYIQYDPLPSKTYDIAANMNSMFTHPFPHFSFTVELELRLEQECFPHHQSHIVLCGYKMLATQSIQTNYPLISHCTIKTYDLTYIGFQR